MKLRISLALLSFVLLVSVFVYQSISFNDHQFHVVFCDVGQGDAIFMRTPNGADILVDGGPDASVLTCLENHMPFWDRKLELVFATHPDADHITGLIDVMKRYEIESYNTSIIEKKTGVFAELTQLLKEKGVVVKQLQSDDVYKLGDGVALRTLWPQKEFRDQMLEKDTNAYSLVQQVKFGEFDLLLTGDITFDILNQFMDEIDQIDVFKAPHHGSYTGINEETFIHVRPRLVIISSGKDNRYGHPHKQVLNELKKHNIKYLRTDEQGDIEIVSDGKRFWVEN